MTIHIRNGIRIAVHPDVTGAAPHWALWHAVDYDRYDGAPDSGDCGHIGFGATEDDAIADFIRVEDEEYCANRCPQERREGEDCALNGGCPLVKGNSNG